MHAVAKYLGRWAEPEIEYAAAIDRTYARCLVVPACREEASLLDGYTDAAGTSPGPTLAVLVVNGKDDAPPEAHAANEHLLRDVTSRLAELRSIGEGGHAWLGTATPHMDVLLVDRASRGRRVPRKEGVGLARKLGADIALALRESGKVASRFIYGTDADATLPEAYFVEPAGEGVAAIAFPFWHEPSDDLAVTRATALYELSLRYYVAGLRWAGSPYAFHTLGSATAVDAEAYAAVRGTPKREAAEDFYLLNKIAKVGSVLVPESRPVRLRSRLSDRTPFGTGKSVAAAVAGAKRSFYAPTCFVALRAFLGELDAFAEHASVERLRAGIHGFEEGPRRAVRDLMERIHADAALEAARVEAKTVEQRRHRLRVWFDGFRTLKFVHAVRDDGAKDLPWREALRAAPFVPDWSKEGRLDEDPTFAALRVAFAEMEHGRALSTVLRDDDRAVKRV